MMNAIGALDGAIRAKADKAELLRLESQVLSTHSSNEDGAVVKVSCLVR